MTDAGSAEGLRIAIVESRALLPQALDALCDVITEVTGRAPQRDNVEYVASFLLMHLCDRVVAGNLQMPQPAAWQLPAIAQLPMAKRSRVLARLGSPRAEICVVVPYLKISFSSEIRAAARLRKHFRWGTDGLTSSGGSAVNESGRRAVMRSGNHLQSAIAQTAPAALVEDHHRLAQWATEMSSPRTRVLYTANAHQSSTEFRYLAYAQRQQGTKIAIHQHGGGYGIDESHLGEDHDIAMSDVFYTFGWQREDLDRRVRPLPTAMPERSRKDAPQGYVLMSLPLLPKFLRFQSFVVPEQIELAVAQTVAFVEHLLPETELTLRSSGRDVFPLQRIQHAPIKVTHDPGHGRGSVAASRAKLVIHNYLGTSWLETLAMDIPTVCFYDPQTYQPRNEARPFLDALAKVGIIHHSGRDAAKFVNSLKGDPTSWWRSSEVQSAREQFVARYANFSENWLEAWQEEFEALLAE